MLDDELEMIAFLNRIRDAAVMLDLEVPGWWLVPDAVDQILAAELVEWPDDPYHRAILPVVWAGEVRNRGSNPLECASVWYPT